MKERGGRLQKGIRDPEKMLLEARDGLTKCRELFILSTLMLMFDPTTKKGAKESLVFWGNIWFNASLEEERIARELVAPAKLKTGAYRTVQAVEDRVRTNASNFIQEVFGLGPEGALELAKAIVDPHIDFTKNIQKKMGVPEEAVYTRKTNVGRRHAIFVHEPALKKVAF